MSTMYRAAELSTQASALHSLVSQGKLSESLAALDRLAELQAALATELAVDALRAGMTQKRIAELLNVSPYTLRGLREAAAL